MAQSEKKPSLGKVLVVGGNGFLGHHVVSLILENWTAQVSVVDLKCDHNRLPGAKYAEVDITDSEELQDIFDKVRPDVVIHTASPKAQGDDAVAHELFRKVNVEGTRCVVEACQKSGVAALVFTSSASIISDNSGDLYNANEQFPVIRGEVQKEYYSETKAEAEDIVLKANRQAPHKLLTCAIRPAALFGEGDGMTAKHMVQLYHEGRTNVQVGNNNNLFDFTYVGNVAHAHLLAARLLLTSAKSATVPLDTERVDGEAFFITNDSPIYFWDFCRAIWSEAGHDRGLDAVWTLPRELGMALGFVSEVVCHIIGRKPTLTRSRIVYSSMTRYYNISKAKERLGYKPIVSLEDGIKKTVAHILEEERAQT